MHTFKRAGRRIEGRQTWRVELVYSVTIFLSAVARSLFLFKYRYFFNLEFIRFKTVHLQY